MTAFQTELLGRLRRRLVLTQSQLEQLSAHWELLRRWNRKLNLTSIKDLPEAVERHYCESLFLGSLVPDRSCSVLDVGSGAGFPGVPMATLRPDCHFTLLESTRKKSVFLREATRHWQNVTVVCQRAEDFQGHHDWAVSRAVRWTKLLPRLRELATCVGLLVGASDADRIREYPGFLWGPPVSLPWGERRVVLLGEVREGFHVEQRDTMLV